MTLRGSADVGFLLVIGRDVLGSRTQLDDTHEAVTEETTPLGQAFDSYGAPGVTNYTLEQGGFYDDGAGNANEALALVGPGVLMFAFEGNTLGAAATCVNGVRTTFTRRASPGAFTRADAVYRSQEGAEEALIHATHAARTTLGPTDQASIDNGASSAAGATGYLGISALNLDGGTALQVTLRDSTDDIAYSDLITFSAVTSLTDALRAQRATVAGTVNRYTLARHEFTGASGASRTATFAVAMVRN